MERKVFWISIFLFFPEGSVQAADKLDSLLSLDFDKLGDLETKVENNNHLLLNPKVLPQPMTLLTAADIRSFGYRTLKEILTSLPGIYSATDHSYSFVGARGLISLGEYNSRILVTVDGMALGDNIYQQTSLAGNEFPLDVDVIDRVEFIPGAGPVNYGNNAFLGIISVVTKSAASKDQGVISASIDSDGELVKRGTAFIPVGSGNALVSLTNLTGISRTVDAYQDGSTLVHQPDQQ